MAKMDVKQAYRNILVNPEDRHLLGINWDGGSICGYGAALRS